jgi:hypothetical protein
MIKVYNVECPNTMRASANAFRSGCRVGKSGQQGVCTISSVYGLDMTLQLLILLAILYCSFILSGLTFNQNAVSCREHVS